MCTQIKAICQNDLVCFPVNGTIGKGVCRSKDDIGGMYVGVCVHTYAYMTQYT